MILGLDISTSITGYTIMDLEGNLVEIGHFNLSKIKEGIWAKVDVMKDGIENLGKNHQITHIFIEEPLSKFSRGRSSSATISLLMRFNGILSYLAYKALGVDPEYYSPSQARKICGLTMRSKRACKKLKIPWIPQKEQAFLQMNKKEPFGKFYHWPLKRTGKLKDHCYDEMDSFVIAKSGFIDKISN